MDAFVPIVAQLGKQLGLDFQLGSVHTILGPAAHVGTSRALPSSAVELSATFGDARHSVQVASPQLPGEPERGLAPVFLHAGRMLVMPTIRLFTGDAESISPEYLSLAHWLDDALRRWRFQRSPGGDIVTVEQQLTDAKPQAALELLAIVVRYALFGSSRSVRRFGLVFPPSPMWVRPVGETDFALHAARSLVVTARLDLSDVSKPVFPRGGIRAAAYRIRPNDPRDRGLDPFHTPEGGEIRLTGRLGAGVAVTPDRRLLPPTNLSLGPSTARLPFAGHNDPRRLLMAANMQTQAVEIEKSEDGGQASNDGVNPPGVNLRIGYIAWQGWNHEDGWVVSESAARKLVALETTDVTLERRALELDEPPLAQVGQSVNRGDLLIQRRYAPALLTDDLDILAALPDLDEAVAVPPEVGDRAPCEGEVTAIDEWDVLDGASLPQDWIAADGLASRYRRVFWVAIRRRLPLTVGDKLANRHGHKGVVGLILPDEQMPRWRGEPLEALIDPISVLNRSNWGQLHETLSAPDPERDDQGRSIIEKPQVGDWLRGPVRAVAGLQFVMRMPQHATDKLAAKPVRNPELRSRSQRFGEMDHWALWAHGLTGENTEHLSPAAAKLSRLLAGAGYRLQLADGKIAVDRWPLDAEPPAEFEQLTVDSSKSLADAYSRFDDEPDQLRALLFDPPIERGGKLIRWLPVIPASDRRPRRLADGTEEPHDLTLDLGRLVRALRKQDEVTARYALRRLMEDAYSEAVGQTATGRDSSKTAWLRRGVLGGRVVPSGRGVISPAGIFPSPLVGEGQGGGLSLDEVGLPPALAQSLFGSSDPADVDGRTLWLKRDPVLHRWGLIALRARVVPGSTLRMPPSLIGPLGADFDGDTVAVFAQMPGTNGLVDSCRPSALAWDGDATNGRAMFTPGKQFAYGLHLLRQSSDQLGVLNAELQTACAPLLPENGSVKSALEQWVRATAATSKGDGGWWSIVERHAIAALAADPGMGLGVLSFDVLKKLPVVRCGAAKDVYGAGRTAQRMNELLAGKGLEINAAGGELDAVADPIAGVMVASKSAVGRFGGALRRLLYSLPRLTPDLVRGAQTLTEQITQRALSVKAGEPPVSVYEFESELRRLLRGEDPPPETGTALRTILAEPRMRAVWTRLQAEFGAEAPPWLAWLRAPHELESLISAGSLSIPAIDLRAAPFINVAGR